MILGISIIYLIQPSHFMFFSVRAEPFINICEHGDSSVNIAVRVWTDTSNYWNVYFYLIEQAKIKFDEENINIPYPQMDLHIQNK